MSDEDFEALLRGNGDSKQSSLDNPPPISRRSSPGARPGAGAFILVLVLVIVGAVGAGGWWAWDQYGERVLNFLGEEEVPDFEGEGSQPDIVVVVQQGDIGEDVAQKLFDQGVTASFESVYQLLLSDSTITFQPGSYRLLSEMSAQAALDALRDPDNRLLYRVTIPEGRTLNQTLEIIAENTDISLADLEEAVDDPSAYGISLPGDTEYLHPLEGYLFPATYEIEPGTSASDVIGRMVSEMNTRLDRRDVPVEQRHELLTKAALIQKEAREEADFYRVARVIENRLADGMALQFDSTVTYWENTFGTVWTTDEARANADNPFNTYYYPGLPAGPIGLPGETAIDAALSPAEGPWRYFVTVNLESGATTFSETLREHNAAVELLREWCAVADNSVYCD